ncbi:unnamed protein product, partial [Meganyctiphanes norvegica]
SLVFSLTAMAQHTAVLLRFIAEVILIMAVVQVTNAVSCYACQNVPAHNYYSDYDRDCGEFDYHGRNGTWRGYDTCWLSIQDNGYMHRGWDSFGHEDGECEYGTYYNPNHNYTLCFCKGDYCNTDSYCAQCGYPKPTPSTTEFTTDITTEHTETTTTAEVSTPTTYVTTAMTTEVPTPTTDITPATTTEPSTPTSITTTAPTTEESTPITVTTSTTTSDLPSLTLKCFHCIDCADVDEDSTPIIEDEFLSCSTIVFLNSAEVIRGGSYDEHPDGMCLEHTGSVSCWCSQDLCND